MKKFKFNKKLHEKRIDNLIDYYNVTSYPTQITFYNELLLKIVFFSNGFIYLNKNNCCNVSNKNVDFIFNYEKP
jgi:hypothetical protein